MHFSVGLGLGELVALATFINKLIKVFLFEQIMEIYCDINQCQAGIS